MAYRTLGPSAEVQHNGHARFPGYCIVRGIVSSPFEPQQRDGQRRERRVEGGGEWDERQAVVGDWKEGCRTRVQETRAMCTLP